MKVRTFPRFLIFVSINFFFFNISFSQISTVHGVVKDGKTGELLESATVLQPPSNGTVTDAKGNYSLKVPPGDVTLIVSYIGMTPDTLHFKVKADEIKSLDISLGSSSLELQQVVIGESKIAVKIQKVTQSVDVMKARVLESNNITNLQQAVVKFPGVTLLDGQMSVRGGSGYAYGSGSRVVLVIDDMPLMTPDRGEIRWPFVPTENTQQIELTKGSSVMQYGSFALNGALNITTGYPTDTPKTKFTFFYQGIGKPPVDSFQWWKRNGKFFDNPNTLGMSFLHEQKFGDVDFVIDGMLQGSHSYLNQEYDSYVRVNNKIRWIPHKLKHLTIELSTNVLYRKDGFQFFFANAATPYIAASGVTLNERFFYSYIDPKLRYIDKSNSVHKILTRVYRQKNLDGTTDFWVFRTEYQFRHDFGNIVTLLGGVNNEHSMVKDGTLGTHNQDFGGGYVSAELNWKWLKANFGAREEYYHLDSAVSATMPVFRAGLNFQFRKYNYLRASFGQSFRIPSIAERFVTYNLAGINILPNDTVKPEKGYTAEIGYKRSFKIGNWLGYWDAVAFWTEFKDMIEFQFGANSNGPYFQSQNVSRARIFGWETSLVGEGKIGDHVDMMVSLGYTYFYGVDLNDTTYGAGANRNIGSFIERAFTHYTLPTAKDYNTWDSITAGMLKYRNPHTFKADFDFIIYNKYHVGTSLQYYSYMTKVDRVFEIVIPGLDEQRQQNRNKGDFVWDMRAGYEFNRNISLNFIVKNLLNANYDLRPAHPDMPRSFTVQMIVNFNGKPKAY